MWHWFFELSTLNWAIERVEGSSGLQWAGCSTAKARECETHPHLKFGLNVLNLWSCSDSSDPPLSSFIIFHQQVVIAAMSPFSCRWLMGSSLALPHLQIVVASGSSCTKKGTHWSPSSTPQNPGCKAGRKARRTKPDKSIAGKWMENGWRMDHLLYLSLRFFQQCPCQKKSVLSKKLALCMLPWACLKTGYPKCSWVETYFVPWK